MAKQKKSTNDERPFFAREHQAHISLDYPQNVPDGEMTLTIHDKNGGAHARWVFKGADDAADFAEMIGKAAKIMKGEIIGTSCEE